MNKEAINQKVCNKKSTGRSLNTFSKLWSNLQVYNLKAVSYFVHPSGGSYQTFHCHCWTFWQSQIKRTTRQCNFYLLVCIYHHVMVEYSALCARLCVCVFGGILLTILFTIQEPRGGGRHLCHTHIPTLFACAYIHCCIWPVPNKTRKIYCVYTAVAAMDVTMIG